MRSPIAIGGDFQKSLRGDPAIATCFDVIPATDRRRSPSAATPARIRLPSEIDDEGIVKVKINVRVLVVLVISAGVIAGAVHLLHEYQVRRSAGTLLRRAEMAEKKGNLAEAATHLKRYLGYRPDDVEALSHYGQILAKGGSQDSETKALEVLDRVLQKEPGRREDRRRAADLAIRLRQFEAARTHLLALIEVVSTPDADAEEKLAQCEIAATRFVEAARWLEKARRHDPSRVSVYPTLASLLRNRLKKPDEADAVMDVKGIKDGVIAHNGRSARAYLSRAIYRRELNLNGAEGDVAKALELAPDDPDVLIVAAHQARDAGRFDDAAKLLARGEAKTPTDFRFYRAIADLEIRTNHLDRAIAALNRGVKSIPAALELRWQLAELLISSGKLEAASNEIEKLREAHYPKELLIYLEASIQAQRGQWTEASRGLTEAMPALALRTEWSGLTKRAFLLLARCHDQLGNPDQQYAACRRAVAIESNEPGLASLAQMELGSALAAIGKFEEAIEAYRLALRLPGTPASALIVIGRLMVARDLRLPPSQRRWDEVDRILDEAARQPALTNSPEIAVLRAEVLGAQEKLDAAEGRLKEATARSPDAIGPRIALAALAERRGKPGEAKSILEEARARLGDLVELRLAFIRYHSGRGGPSAEAELSRIRFDADKLPDTDRRRVLMALIDAYKRLGNSGQAAKIRDRLAAEQPGHLGLRLAQFIAAFEEKDEVTAWKVLNEVRTIEGKDGGFWRYGQSRLLLDRWRSEGKKRQDPRLAEARRLLAEASERRPDWATIALAEAEVEILLGEPGSALRSYLRAIELGDRSQSAVRGAVELLYRQGRYAQADQILRRLQEEAPLSADLRQLASNVSLRNRDDVRALDLARQATAAKPDDSAAHTWLGQVLAASAADSERAGQAQEAVRRRDEADQELTRGVELGRDRPDAWVSLVRFLVQTGKTSRAEAAAQQAEARLKGPGADLAIARCLEAVGWEDQAESRYKTALAAQPDDAPLLQAYSTLLLRHGRLADAEPNLRRLIDLRTRTPTEADWARRVLALALEAGRDREGRRKAVALLGLDDDDSSSSESAGKASGEDLRAQAQFLSRRPGRTARTRAITLLSSLVAREEASPADRMLLAALLEADGDWNKALVAAQGLAAEFPADPAPALFLARGLLARNEPDTAEPWVRALEKTYPRAPEVVELRARSLVARGKPDEAIGRLETLAKDVPGRALAVAGVLENLGLIAPAEAAYRRQAAAGPEGKLALVGFLGRQGRSREAIDASEVARQSPGIKPEDVSSVAVTALYVGKPDQTTLDRVETAIRTDLRKTPSSLRLQFDLANLQILRGRYAEAEAAFRAIQKSDRELAAPLNNLAWLLAVRKVPGSEALDLIKQAIDIDGPTPDLLDTRGLVLLSAGQVAPAITDLEEAVSSSRSSGAYFHLAQAYRAAGRARDAGEALRKARTAGLKEVELHPLEQSSLRELSAALAR